MLSDDEAGNDVPNLAFLRWQTEGPGDAAVQSPQSHHVQISMPMTAIPQLRFLPDALRLNPYRGPASQVSARVAENSRLRKRLRKMSGGSR